VTERLQKQLLKEQLQYLDYLDVSHEMERQKEAERERLIREDQEEQNNKQLMQWKLDAAARRRLFCDASAVQKLQREEKGNYSVIKHYPKPIPSTIRIRIHPRPQLSESCRRGWMHFHLYE